MGHQPVDQPHDHHVPAFRRGGQPAAGILSHRDRGLDKRQEPERRNPERHDAGQDSPELRWLIPIQDQQCEEDASGEQQPEEVGKDREDPGEHHANQEGRVRQPVARILE